MTSSGSPIVVTGAGRGLGRAMALGLARQGNAVIAVDRDAAPLAELAETAAGLALSARTVDLAADGGPEALIEEILAEEGSVAGLVNAAGIGQETISADFVTQPVLSWEVDPAHWRAIFAVNAEAVFRLCRAVIPGMVAARRGRIVNVTTSLETMLRKGMSPYGPSKAAVEAMSAIMAKELEGTGVTVNILVPGGPAATRMMPGVPEQFLIPPEVMVAPLLYLLSDAADLVTGRRIRAADWNADSTAEEAMAAAAAPAAWAGLAGGAARSLLPSHDRAAERMQER